MEQLIKFLAVSRFAESNGASTYRAREIGLIAGMIPGNMGLFAGLIAANNETPPAKPPPRGDGPVAAASPGKSPTA